MAPTTSQTTPKAWRRCSEVGCETILSRYNRAEKCFAHDRPGPEWTGLRGRWSRDHAEEPEGYDVPATQVIVVPPSEPNKVVRWYMTIREPLSWPVECPVCERKSATLRSLTNHARSAHNLRIKVSAEEPIGA